MDSNVADQLAWERRRASLAAGAAFLGAILPLWGLLGSGLATKDHQQEDGIFLLYTRSHAGTLIIYSVLVALGAFAIGIALNYLLTATRARRPEVPAPARPLAIFGPIVFGLGQVGFQVALVLAAKHFAEHTHQSYQDGVDARRASGVVVVASIGLAAQLALGFAFVLISLNAMRAGLLTRFMGILGILVGVLFVIPIGSSLPIVQSFWLAALGAVILGRWPNGVPPAWATGQAEPWPSQQELREQRAAAAGDDPPPARTPRFAKPAKTVVEEEHRPAPRPQPISARKRKRKKRR